MKLEKLRTHVFYGEKDTLKRPRFQAFYPRALARTSALGPFIPCSPGMSKRPGLDNRRVNKCQRLAVATSDATHGQAINGVDVSL